MQFKLRGICSDYYFVDSQATIVVMSELFFWSIIVCLKYFIIWKETHIS